MIAVIYHKVVIVYKPVDREAGLAKCLKVFFLLLFPLIHVVMMLLLFHVVFPLVVIRRQKGNSFGWLGF